MPLVFSQLIQRLGRHAKPQHTFGEVKRRAAVAIALVERADEVQLLMIRRATRPGDPWSGHMGFPGGRRDPEDVSNLACAIRETEEELGLTLQEHQLVAELGEVNTGWRPDRPDMLVTPFVFVLDHVPELTPNHEVDGIVWVPLGFLMDQSNRVPYNWEWKGTPVQSEAYLYQGDRIWGLSLQMLDELMDAAQR